MDGTRLVMEYAEKILGAETVFGYQYSPEIFTDTELDFALEVCEAVMDVWQPEAGPRDHPQPARHRGAFHALHARGPLRVDVAATCPAASTSACPSTRTTTAVRPSPPPSWR